jgi:hypothetical protein
MPEWSNFVDADIVNRDKTITFKFRSEIEIFNAYKRASFFLSFFIYNKYDII